MQAFLPPAMNGYVYNDRLLKYIHPFILPRLWNIDTQQSGVPSSHTKDIKMVLAALLLGASNEKVEVCIGTGRPGATVLCFSEISRYVDGA